MRRRSQFDGLRKEERMGNTAVKSDSMFRRMYGTRY
jgi:hypothetical protein